MNREAERKRLVELLQSKSCWYNDCETGCDKCGNVGISDADIEKIADHLLDNGIIVPPVKPNTFAYFFIRNEVKEGYVREILIDKGGAKIAVCYDGTYFKIFKPYDFGRTVFLTREEAQKALEGSGGK